MELTLDLESSNTESSGNAWWVLLLIFGLLALALLVLVLLRRRGFGATAGPAPVVVSKALWELEEERWELAEKVLDTKPPVVPQQWTAQWSANDGAPEKRFYDLTFGIGGKLEGIGEGRNGAWRHCWVFC